MKKRNLSIRKLFKCGAGFSQLAITPQGELKACLMLAYPRYRILGIGLQNAREKLSQSLTSIISDKNYSCHSCKLRLYCKCCPAQSQLYNRTLTSCVPECRQVAKLKKGGR